MPEFDSPWKEALDEFLQLFLLLFFADIEQLSRKDSLLPILNGLRLPCRRSGRSAL